MSEIVERVARAIWPAAFMEDLHIPVAEIEACKAQAMKKARAAIRALWDPDEAMWGGLARDLVMWDRGMPNQYGSTLYKHLRSTGKPIPTWLLEQIPDIDHTPPKGTVAVCIFKAMLDDALAAPPAEAGS